MNHLHQLLGFFPVLVGNCERNLFTKKKTKLGRVLGLWKSCILILWPTLRKGNSWVWGGSIFKARKPQSQLSLPCNVTAMADLQRWQSHRKLLVTTLSAPCCCDSNMSTPKADSHTNMYVEFVYKSFTNRMRTSKTVPRNTARNSSYLHGAYDCFSFSYITIMKMSPLCARRC